MREYGKHADAEERREGAKRIRRSLMKPLPTLFAGEPNGRRFRVAIDELMKSGGSKRGGYDMGAVGEGGEPLLSELIMRAAEKTLSPAILDMTREESFEMSLMKEEKTAGGLGGSESNVKEWNMERKERERNEKESSE